MTRHGRQAARLLATAALISLAVSGCARQSDPAPSPAAETDTAAVEWRLHGGTWDEARHSPLDQINATNVQRLGLAWEAAMDSARGLEATPIMKDGVLYATSTWSRVFAFDARTGRRLWNYDPEVPGQRARDACCDVVNRGVAIWRDRVFVGTLDGRLVALDRSNGEVVWDVLTVDPGLPYTITGAPRVVKDMIVIGNGGAEFNVRGYVTAYDAQTGEQRWRFYTVPGNPDEPFEHPELAMAARTWSGTDWDTTGGGGTVWDSMVYDPELELLYVGAGNGGPWGRHDRSPGGGDNLFLASILALDPDTGKLAWHYQTAPGDSWDYTATQHMVLADLNIDGAVRKTLLQAPKNGFFYVLDRQTGELISAQKYVTANWASHVDLATGRPVENPGANWASEPRLIYPSAAGGHNWHPMAMNRDTGLVYVPAREAGWVHHPDKETWFELGVDDLAAVRSGQPQPPFEGQLIAWDPVAQAAAWRIRQPGIYNGGVLSTAGKLVFHGDGDGYFYAHAADSGAELLKLFLGTGVIAPPITYQLDGTQYIALLAGFGGPVFNTMEDSMAATRYANNGRLLVFKLDGGEVPLPPALPAPHPVPEFPAPETLSAAALAEGEQLYAVYCGGCHGLYGSRPMLPDLRRMALETHAIFKPIVLGGAYAPKGMGSFADLLTEAQVELIHDYVKVYAAELRAREAADPVADSR